MKKADLLRELVAAHLRDRPYFTDDQSSDSYRDTLCEIGCDYYYGGSEMDARGEDDHARGCGV